MTLRGLVVIGLVLARVARFERNVEKAGPDACWPWSGSRDGDGYGRFRIARSEQHASRIALALSGTPLDKNTHALHRCDNPPCCNPAHLFAGTAKDNLHDAMAKGRARLGTPVDRRGSRNGRAVLTEEIVRAMRAARAAGVSVAMLAASSGVSVRTAREAIEGRKWRHVS